MSSGAGQRGARRGAVLGLLAGSLALGAHLAGGGPLPHPLGLALALAVCALVGALASGMRRGLPRAIVLVTLAQSLLHGIFLLMAPVTPSGGAGALGAAHHGTVPDAAGLTATGLAADPAHAHAGMWWAHALAAVITIGLVFHGERLALALLGVASTLARRVVRHLAPVFDGVAPRRPHVRRPSAWSAATLPAQCTPAVRPLRGPPAPVGA